MCGRLVLTSSYKEKIKDIFDRVEANEWQPPRYNITPGQKVPMLDQKQSALLQWSPWGHEKSSAADGGKSRLLINARAESIERLPTFKESFKANRCIVFADGFYEWHRAGKQRPQPHFFEMKDHAILPLAGLLFPNPDEGVDHCVIVTTEANSLMHSVHHRMPVIFSRASMITWLRPESSPDTLKALLQPYPSNKMASHPVSTAVNKASAEGAKLIERVQIVEQTNLF